MNNELEKYNEIKIWIEKIIDSCETHNQTNTARKLILNFQKNIYGKNTDKIKYFKENLINPLLTRLFEKQLTFNQS